MIAVHFPLVFKGDKTRAGHVAVIDGYKWASKHQMLEDLLNSKLDPDGPRGDDPNPDATAAQAAIKLWGGEIIKQKAKPEPQGVIQ